MLADLAGSGSIGTALRPPERAARAPPRRIRGIALNRAQLPLLVHPRRDPRGGRGPAPRPGAPGGSEGFYPGTCRALSARERAERERAGRPAAWRLDARAERIAFEDRLAGTADAVVDDFVIWRGDPQGPSGGPAYNLAVVVDDAAAGIGEVVRGDDLLETTPRQILLGRLLGLPVPRYAHVPLVLGTDGRRLAKTPRRRHAR